MKVIDGTTTATKRCLGRQLTIVHKPSSGRFTGQPEVNSSIADQPTIDHALNKRDVINFACAGTFRREAKRRPDERHTRTIEESRGPSHQVIALPELG